MHVFSTPEQASKIPMTSALSRKECYSISRHIFLFTKLVRHMFIVKNDSIFFFISRTVTVMGKIFHWHWCKNDRKKPDSIGSACFICDAVLYCNSYLRSRFHSFVLIGSVQRKRCDNLYCGVVVHQSDECNRYTFYNLDCFYEFNVPVCCNIYLSVK